jgi:hypothetical protein
MTAEDDLEGEVASMRFAVVVGIVAVVPSTLYYI